MGRSRLRDHQEKQCFFCGTRFEFKYDELIVCASGEGWISEAKERHVCPACTKMDDDGLARRMREAAERHRREAARLREQAEVEDLLAERFEALEDQPIERVWNASTF